MGRVVYAIRYGHRAESTRSENFYGGDPHDGPMPMAYFMWVIDDAVRPIVVDTGFSRQTAVGRPGREIVADRVDALRRLSVEPDEVQNVVLTHLHYDHAGGLDLFPAAQFWVQDAEMAFWTGRYAARAGFMHAVEPDDVVTAVRLNFQRRLNFVNGDATVVDGVTVHRVGGHSDGLQVVRVETSSGPLVLAADAAHYYENLEQDRPFSTIHSLADMYGAFDRLRVLAGPDGVIVPGHDPLVLERFPTIPGLEGVAVRLSSECPSSQHEG